MALVQAAMTLTVAIGIGCRRGIAAEPIVALVRETLAGAGLALSGATLFSVDAKTDEQGLVQAAAQLAAPVVFLPRETLAGIATPTMSRHAQVLLGVSCLAESAALAGAGEGAVLVVKRVARDGVTCAIARAAR